MVRMGQRWRGPAFDRNEVCRVSSEGADPWRLGRLGVERDREGRSGSVSCIRVTEKVENALLNGWLDMSGTPILQIEYWVP
jgi:hypothetical protein